MTPHQPPVGGSFSSRRSLFNLYEMPSPRGEGGAKRRMRCLLVDSFHDTSSAPAGEKNRRALLSSPVAIVYLVQFVRSMERLYPIRGTSDPSLQSEHQKLCQHRGRDGVGKRIKLIHLRCLERRFYHKRRREQLHLLHRADQLLHFGVRSRRP